MLEIFFFWLISCFSAFRTVLSKKWISVKGVGPYDPLRTPPPLRLGKKPKFVAFFLLKPSLSKYFFKFIDNFITLFQIHC